MNNKWKNSYKCSRLVQRTKESTKLANIFTAAWSSNTTRQYYYETSFRTRTYLDMGKEMSQKYAMPTKNIWSLAKLVSVQKIQEGIFRTRRLPVSKGTVFWEKCLLVFVLVKSNHFALLVCIYSQEAVPIRSAQRRQVRLGWEDIIFASSKFQQQTHYMFFILTPTQTECKVGVKCEISDSPDCLWNQNQHPQREEGSHLTTWTKSLFRMFLCAQLPLTYTHQSLRTTEKTPLAEDMPETRSRPSVEGKDQRRVIAV